MTIDAWLRIAQILSTLIAPLLAGYILSRVINPTLTPDTNQPKNKIQRIGRWFITYRWPIRLYFVSLILSIYNLMRALRDPDQPIRDLVIALSIAMGGILFHLTTLFILVLFSLAFSTLRSSIDSGMRLHLKASDQLLHWMERYTEAISQASKGEAVELPSTPESRFDRILSALKKLKP